MKTAVSTMESRAVQSTAGGTPAPSVSPAAAVALRFVPVQRVGRCAVGLFEGAGCSALLNRAFGMNDRVGAGG